MPDYPTSFMKHKNSELTIEFNFADQHKQIVDFYANSLYNKFTEANELC
jgi:hypothetical protein